MLKATPTSRPSSEVQSGIEARKGFSGQANNLGLLYRLYSKLYHYICEKPSSLNILEEAFLRLYRITNRQFKPLLINGRRMNIQLHDVGISTELALFKVHEPISTQLLPNYLKKGYSCLEIGANMGYYTLLISDIIGREGRIYTVEPHPENFRTLFTNISINNLRNVVCFNVACSNYEGYGSMKVMPQSNWHRLLENHDTSGLPVEVKTVDSLTKNFKRLDLMRMDVEGHEDKIIEGSHKTIEMFQPTLFLEFHPSLAGKTSTLKLLANLKDYGYKISHFIPRFLDCPVVGKLSHAKKISIDEYMDRIENADPIDGREANVFLSM